jgi:6-pyruvoyltetrahydropterin/6-carboxytetrahydropterin synthase
MRMLQNSTFAPIFNDQAFTFTQIFKVGMVYITRKEHFNAAHKLYNPDWSAEKNEAVFGRCANANWHGHNFDLYITVKGVPNPETGFVFDAKKLSAIVQDRVIDVLDHRNINEEVEFMKGKLCSIENLAMGIWGQLEDQMPAGVRLHAVKLCETPRIFVEYFGE